MMSCFLFKRFTSLSRLNTLEFSSCKDFNNNSILAMFLSWSEIVFWVSVCATNVGDG